jgi:hypothetical protein
MPHLVIKGTRIPTIIGNGLPSQEFLDRALLEDTLDDGYVPHAVVFTGAQLTLTDFGNFDL